jgi:hypothetical protein
MQKRPMVLGRLVSRFNVRRHPPKEVLGKSRMPPKCSNDIIACGGFELLPGKLGNHLMAKRIPSQRWPSKYKHEKNRCESHHANPV